MNDIFRTAECAALEIPFEVGHDEMTQSEFEILTGQRTGPFRDESILFGDHAEIGLFGFRIFFTFDIDRSTFVQTITIADFSESPAFTAILFGPIGIDDGAFRIYSIYVYTIFIYYKKPGNL